MRDAGGVVEQLAEAHPVAIGQRPGQPALQGIRQRQPTLRGQPQDDGGDQRLGHAAGPEAQLWPHRLAGPPVGQAAGGSPAAMLVPDPAGGAGRPGGHQPVQQLLQLAHVPPRRAASPASRCPWMAAAAVHPKPGTTGASANGWTWTTTNATSPPRAPICSSACSPAPPEPAHSTWQSAGPYTAVSLKWVP